MLHINISTSCVLCPSNARMYSVQYVFYAQTFVPLEVESCPRHSKTISSFRLFTLLKGKHLKEIQPSGAGTCWICSDIWRLSTRPSFKWLEDPVFVACFHASQDNLIYHVNVYTTIFKYIICMYISYRIGQSVPDRLFYEYFRIH